MEELELPEVHNVTKLNWKGLVKKFIKRKDKDDLVKSAENYKKNIVRTWQRKNLKGNSI